MKLALLGALVLSLACGGAVSGSLPNEASEAPAVIVGGVVDPPAASPAAHELELSDGSTSYRVMFGRDTGEAIVDRINAVTSNTIVASIDEAGRLTLTTVETGPDAELHILRGYALPMLGLEQGESAFGN